MALAVLRDGRILAGDMQKGLMISRDAGNTWTQNLRAGLMGLALNPADPKRLLAAGPGVLLSTNGGASWKRVLDIPEGGGPVAATTAGTSLTVTFTSVHCANGSPGAFPPPFTLTGTLLPDGTLDFQDILTRPGGA